MFILLLLCVADSCCGTKGLISLHSSTSVWSMYKTKHSENISHSLMELYVETLTGLSMILYVSPLDTVLDVKTYIQKLEGIKLLAVN